MSEPHVIVLGGGPAGLGAAYQLRRRGGAAVTLLEQNEVVGGNAGSFVVEDQPVDYGSHRLHPACDPAILADIRALLGDDLLDRPRHGRIRLRGRWIHFPLKPLDLLLRLDRGFALGVTRDVVARVLPRDPAGTESFASVLRASLGRSICEDFYFPYARKIWGREPGELSAIQAKRRVSAGSFAKLARKVLAQVPGLKRPGAGRFFYPRFGYGQISDAYAAAAREAGAELMLGWRVTAVEQPEGGSDPWRVTARRDDMTRTLQGDHLWSTLPISLLARLMVPRAPPEVAAAAERIRYRSMLLIYVALEVDRFSEYDAHYFPDGGVRITRLSEPKNYTARGEPVGRTVLCAELPCSAADDCWSMDEADLGRLVAEDLARAGIPLPRAPTRIHVRRLPFAYPIYETGYEEPFGTLDRWADSLPRALTFGRQGLFAHDNTHHALYMAYAAAECLTDGAFDQARWRRYREVFATHVVED